MIGTIDIKINAAHPNMPLSPVYTFVGSPQQLRVINVPKAIGNWKITAVQVTVNYPDNSSPSVEATLTGGCWSATLPAPSAVGQSLMGFKVTASGVDEHNDPITSYVLGKGDAYVLDDDATITVDGTTYYVHIVDAIPETPHKGDLDISAMKIYDGSEWRTLGAEIPEGTMNHGEFSTLTPDLDPEESSIADIMNKLNNVIGLLRGTSAALAVIFTLGAFGAVEVQTAKLSTLPGKTMVVTNVTGAAAASDLAAKQDALPYATNSIPAAVITNAPWLTSETDPTVADWAKKPNPAPQPVISDLATIRAGAEAGATAVQPAAISDMETQTHAAATYQAKGNYQPLVKDSANNYTAVTMGTRSSTVGQDSVAIGQLTVASGDYSVAVGPRAKAQGVGAVAIGNNTTAAANYSIAIGSTASVQSGHDFAFVWSRGNYSDHGAGTFNISPTGGAEGFWIGSTNLAQHIRNYAPATDLSNYYTRSQADTNATAKANAAIAASTIIANKAEKSEIPDVSGFVPYTGATDDVDLGDHALSAAYITSSGVYGNSADLYFGTGHVSSGIGVMWDSVNQDDYMRIPGGSALRIYENGIGLETIDERIARLAPTYVPSHTNATFAAEVLAVGLEIDPTALQWLKDIGAIAGSTTGKVSISTLLAALLGALMWLKNNKADKTEIRYDLNATSASTMADRTTNALTMTANTALVFPAAVSGKCRDFLLNLTYTAGEMTLPTGITKVGDELTFTAGKNYLISFTEIAANKFYVRAIEIG